MSERKSSDESQESLKIEKVINNSNYRRKQKCKRRKKDLDEIHNRILKAKTKLDNVAKHKDKEKTKDKEERQTQPKICNRLLPRILSSGIFRNGTKSQDIRKEMSKDVLDKARLNADALTLFNETAPKIKHCLIKKKNKKNLGISENVGNQNLSISQSEKFTFISNVNQMLSENKQDNLEILTPNEIQILNVLQRNENEIGRPLLEYNEGTKFSEPLKYYHYLCNAMSNKYNTDFLKNVSDPVKNTFQKLKEYINFRPFIPENNDNNENQASLNEGSILSTEFQACTRSASQSSSVDFEVLKYIDNPMSEARTSEKCTSQNNEFHSEQNKFRKDRDRFVYKSNFHPSRNTSTNNRVTKFCEDSEKQFLNSREANFRSTDIYQPSKSMNLYSENQQDSIRLDFHDNMICNPVIEEDVQRNMYNDSFEENSLFVDNSKHSDTLIFSGDPISTEEKDYIAQDYYREKSPITLFGSVPNDDFQKENDQTIDKHTLENCIRIPTNYHYGNEVVANRIDHTNTQTNDDYHMGIYEKPKIHFNKNPNDIERFYQNFQNISAPNVLNPLLNQSKLQSQVGSMEMDAGEYQVDKFEIEDVRLHKNERNSRIDNHSRLWPKNDTNAVLNLRNHFIDKQSLDHLQDASFSSYNIDSAKQQFSQQLHVNKSNNIENHLRGNVCNRNANVLFNDINDRVTPMATSSFPQNAQTLKRPFTCEDFIYEKIFNEIRFNEMRKHLQSNHALYRDRDSNTHLCEHSMSLYSYLDMIQQENEYDMIRCNNSNNFNLNNNRNALFLPERQEHSKRVILRTMDDQYHTDAADTIQPIKYLATKKDMQKEMQKIPVYTINDMEFLEQEVTTQMVSLSNQSRLRFNPAAYNENIDPAAYNENIDPTAYNENIDPAMHIESNEYDFEYDFAQME